MDTNPKVAFYIRSANGNTENLSRQRRTLEKFISQKIDLVDRPIEIYTDECQSGLRPGIDFERMHQDITSGKVNVVMVSSLDRISRKLMLIYNFLNFLRIKKARFLCADGNLDSSYHGPLLNRDRSQPRKIA